MSDPKSFIDRLLSQLSRAVYVDLLPFTLLSAPLLLFFVSVPLKLAHIQFVVLTVWLSVMVYLIFKVWMLARKKSSIMNLVVSQLKHMEESYNKKRQLLIESVDDRHRERNKAYQEEHERLQKEVQRTKESCTPRIADAKFRHTAQLAVLTTQLDELTSKNEDLTQELEAKVNRLLSLQEEYHSLKKSKDELLQWFDASAQLEQKAYERGVQRGMSEYVSLVQRACGESDLLDNPGKHMHSDLPRTKIVSTH